MKATTKKLIRYIVLILVALLVIIQFYPIDKSVPDYNPAGDFISVTQPSEEVEQILRTSCYDCHSFETRYPWYSSVAPVSWWMKDHINRAREELNFSKWSQYEIKKADHKLEEIVEEVEAHAMPISSYLIIHTEARLDPEKEKALLTFIKQLRDN